MIELRNLSKTYAGGAGTVEAVSDVSLKIEDGEIFGIIGLSGAGKSTLVRCINYIETPTGGEVLHDGVALGSLSRKELLKKRREISMIFQGFNLLSQRTALRNVCYPMEVAGKSRREAAARAMELLALVGLKDRAEAFPSQLSGGQKQRVAIARALASNPKVLLCDEATSALDPNTTHSILELLRQINRDMGVTIVIITHEMRVIEQICGRVAVMEDGRVAEEGPVSEVFRSPKSEIAKQLVLPKNEAVAKTLGTACLRLVFDGESASEAIISAMAIECRAEVNILIADTKLIEGKSRGEMIIQLPEGDKARRKITGFLDAKGVHWEEVDINAE